MALNLLKCTRNLALSLKGLRSCCVPMVSHHKYTTSTDEDKKVYELRVYQVYPKDVNTFMDLSADWLHIRFRHSKLIGYWTSEIGGINDLVHLWEYDHRAAVRQALAQDKEWVQNYFSKIKPWMPRQDNMLMQQLTNCNLNQPELKGDSFYQDVQSGHSRHLLPAPWSPLK
ncbi:hypothetical protein KUTeg_019628 [Tegillarca granosa]|uniref:NIPSNAP domain-containing protein n=1 Tax=Tegillarca granosa TaxID=220873 RepID=A0ABQ9ED64_TEGGR|nr:hypothetical protein KUTeg_019628 [Tegillarca granosa]